MHCHIEVHIKQQMVDHNPGLLSDDIAIRHNTAQSLLAVIMEPFNDDRSSGGFAWDWYVIGGRWTGAHDDYDCTTDPDNYETCRICKGTGRRDDALGVQAREKDPSYLCNGCAHIDFENHKWIPGKYPGKSLKWQLNPYKGDVMKTQDVREDLTTYGMIVDGQYVASNESYSEAKQDTKRVRAQLRELGCDDGVLITVDCHD